MKRIVYLMGAILSTGIALVLVMVAGLPQRADYTGTTFPAFGAVAPEIGSLAPPFTRPTLAGQSFDLLDLRGETIIVNFWATWCAPCYAEMPILQDIYATNDIRMVGVNMGEAAATAQRWVDEFGLSFDIVLDQQRAIVALYRLRGQPSTYVIDPDGVITHIFYGAVSPATLQNAIDTHWRK
jgi:peroxiredoxin